MCNRSKMTCRLRKGSRSPHTHDDDVGQQIGRNIQDAFCHWSRFYHHLRFGKAARVREGSCRVSAFRFLYCEMWRVPETPFDDVYQRQMCFIFMRQRHSEF